MSIYLDYCNFMDGIISFELDHEYVVYLFSIFNSVL